MKAGDLVKLKSGGPTMTVERKSSNDSSLSCVWYNTEKDEFVDRYFQETSLIPSTPPEA